MSPTSFHLSPSSFHLSPRLGACGRVPAGVSPTSFHLFPISFHLSPTTFHLSSTSFHVSPSSFHLSPRLGACGRVPGWLVSHCLSFVSHFFSFVSHYLSFVSYFFSFVSLFICLPAGCLWSGSRLACLPLPFIVSQAGCLWSGFPPFSAGHVAFLFVCLPGLSLLVSALLRWPCSISIRLSPRSVTAGVRPFPSAMQHFYSLVSQVRLLVSAVFRW